MVRTDSEAPPDKIATLANRAMLWGINPEQALRKLDELIREGFTVEQLEKAFDEAEGKDKPWSYFLAIVRKQAESKTEGGMISWAHARYHNAQADPNVDTAAKRLARKAGLDSVECPCGEFARINGDEA